MNSTISAILVQKRTPAMRSQIFFGGTKGNSVSAGVGMPCKKNVHQSRARDMAVIKTDSDKVHFCGFPYFGAESNFVAKV